MSLSSQASAGAAYREAPEIIRCLDFASDDTQASVAVAALDAGERSRSSARRRCRGLLAWLLRGIDSSLNWQLEHLASGQPVLNLDGDRSLFHVSFSHSQDAIAAGISRSASIGVDIETVRPLPRMAGIAGLLGWPEQLDAHDFWYRWTLAEAIAKHDGSSVLSSAPAHPLRRQPLCPDDMSVHCERIEPSLALAVVIGRAGLLPATDTMRASLRPPQAGF